VHPPALAARRLQNHGAHVAGRACHAGSLVEKADPACLRTLRDWQRSTRDRIRRKTQSRRDSRSRRDWATDTLFARTQHIARRAQGCCPTALAPLAHMAPHATAPRWYCCTRATENVGRPRWNGASRCSRDS
jgi:hypothetical protein